MEQTYDAVVIGAGHNGLIAGVRLAAAGWSVCVVEQAERAGGAIWSGELTAPGYVHDGFSTNHNLFLASPFYAEHADELANLGLAYEVSSTPFANAFEPGRALRVVQDVDQTIAGFDAVDRDGWRRLDDLFLRLSPPLFALYGAPPPTLRDLRSSTALGRALLQARHDRRDLAWLLTASTRALGDAYLETPEARTLLACWGLHLDFGPDVSGGAMFAFMEAFADQRGGMAITRGGASRMVDALVAMLKARGGELRLSAPAGAIKVGGGRARTVVLADGTPLHARRAVVASTTPAALARLVEPAQAPLTQTARRYRHGPGTMMVHLALDGPIPWLAKDGLAEAAYVHIAPSVDALARAYTDAMAGALPAEPLLVVGQTSVVDPSRAPDGGHVVWIQVRAVPGRPVSDAAGALDVSPEGWPALAEPMAERVLDILERHAPGVRGRIVGRAVMTPDDLERADPNLVGGDSLGGSMHLAQSFVLRPSTRTGVESLWLTGSATWPGAGINALPGDHTAAAVLRIASGKLGRRRSRVGRQDVITDS
jgi:phytoene dehydrogenase-like protein